MLVLNFSIGSFQLHTSFACAEVVDLTQFLTMNKNYCLFLFFGLFSFLNFELEAKSFYDRFCFINNCDDAIVANAGSDQSVCGATVLSATAPSGLGESGRWSVVSGAGGTFGDVNSPVSSFSGRRGVSYTLRWTVSNGVCPIASDDVFIDILENPSSNAGNDQTVCGTSISLRGDFNGLSSSWSIVSGSGGVFSNESSPSTRFSGVVGESYVLRYTASNGICIDATDDVVVTFYELPRNVNAGSDQSACGATVLSATAPSGLGESGRWSVVSGAGGTFGDVNSPVSSFSGRRGVSYTLRWTVSNGVCSIASDDVFIDILENPSSNAGNDQTVCGTSISLRGDFNGLSSSWSIVSGSGGVFSNESSPSTRFSGVAGESYVLRYTASNGICIDATDDVIVTFYETPRNVNAGSDQDVLDIAILDANEVLGLNESGSWSIVFGDGNEVIGEVSSPSSTFTGTKGFSYTLRWTVDNGVCPIATDDVVISFDETLSISNNITSLNDKKIFIYPNPITNYFRVSIPFTNIKLYDLNGIQLIETQSSIVNMENVASGIYLVGIESEQGLIYRKIIK